ncbi:hypothetical protein [Aneurinibacillus thermoaerophilus]|uniref:hypothetical protein n=1 Tax=Aneurinibacillus thermoaerophilus TaxID=143495 RepID=UPI002E1BC70C|nr:hypothetical protein [Aneurinibacillus thermoaerophilus]
MAILAPIITMIRSGLCYEKITDYKLTNEALRKEERAISDAFFRQRVTAVRLILEGFSTVKAAEVLGICH